jgi:hypothetical protein
MIYECRKPLTAWPLRKQHSVLKEPKPCEQLALEHALGGDDTWTSMMAYAGPGALPGQVQSGGFA